MDTTRLLTIVRQELSRVSRVSGVPSLALQNHLYGCFIVMEDIAQGTLDAIGADTGAEAKDGLHLIRDSLHLSLPEQFGYIGIRYYGFILDGASALNDCSAEYKEAWMDLFREMSLLREMDIVDELEDKIIGVLQELHAEKPEDGFFLHALEQNGCLSPEWSEKALFLLYPQMTNRPLPVLKTQGIARAKAERVTGKTGTDKRRRLRFTYRKKKAPTKPSLSCTRRSQKAPNHPSS
jgi:hypothetical protein